jgi:hypothetical protein
MPPRASTDDILIALAALIERERHPRTPNDVLSDNVLRKKLGSGNSWTLTTSNCTTVANPLMPQAGDATVDAAVPYLGALANTASNANNQAPFQIERLPADVYTVHLTPLQLPAPGTLTAPLYLSTEAQIVFSVDGRQNIRRVSVNQGMRISGQADAISVTVRDNSQIAIDGRIPSATQYMVNLSVSRGIRTDLTQPPTLAPADATGFVIVPARMSVAAGGTNFDIPVPQGVGVISANVTAFAGTAITEGNAQAQWMQDATVLRQWDPRVFPWVPIVPGTNKLRIQNNQDMGTIQFSVLFGIDG